MTTLPEFSRAEIDEDTGCKVCNKFKLDIETGRCPLCSIRPKQKNNTEFKYRLLNKYWEYRRMKK